MAVDQHGGPVNAQAIGYHGNHRLLPGVNNLEEGCQLPRAFVDL
jgi:hypothetical protein